MTDRTNQSRCGPWYSKRRNLLPAGKHERKYRIVIRSVYLPALRPPFPHSAHLRTRRHHSTAGIYIRGFLRPAPRAAGGCAGRPPGGQHARVAGHARGGRGTAAGTRGRGRGNPSALSPFPSLAQKLLSVSPCVFETCCTCPDPGYDCCPAVTAVYAPVQRAERSQWPPRDGPTSGGALLDLQPVRPLRLPKKYFRSRKPAAHTHCGAYGAPTHSPPLAPRAPRPAATPGPTRGRNRRPPPPSTWMRWRPARSRRSWTLFRCRRRYTVPTMLVEELFGSGDRRRRPSTRSPGRCLPVAPPARCVRQLPPASCSRK